MAKQQIALVVTFQAAYMGDDRDMPDDTTVEETVSLIIPQMDEKFVVFPKVLEGVTDQVIKIHRAKVNDYLAKKATEERARKERMKMLGFMHQEDGKNGTATITASGETVPMPDAVEQ